MLESLVEDFLVFNTSQLLVDYEASEFVFSCTRFFTLAAAGTGIKVVAGVSQPGTVGAVRVFQADHITVFHRSTIKSIAGENLESGVRIFQPVAFPH